MEQEKHEKSRENQKFKAVGLGHKSSVYQTHKRRAFCYYCGYMDSGRKQRHWVSPKGGESIIWMFTTQIEWQSDEAMPLWIWFWADIKIAVRSKQWYDPAG